jgi:nucleoside-diphosphate-sugar epimerase
MKIAVFGGTGFLGYDFVRYALDQGVVKPIIYSSNPKNLTNVARHDIDIRLYPSSDPQSIILDDDVEVIVNYAHPFESRDKISGKKQIERFVRFVEKSKQTNSKLHLIHLSSMSVFEPFDQEIYYDESMPLHPPRDDRYAKEKVLAETALLKLPDAESWQLHLRPTVVYGPFCGVWTDRIFGAFKNGDVGFENLSGKIQPIYGRDVSKFVYNLAMNFRPGVYNLSGSEEYSWYDFATVFRDIVNCGQLVKLDSDFGKKIAHHETTFLFFKNNFRELMQAVRKEPAFDRMALRVARHLPERAVNWTKSVLLGRGGAMLAPINTKLVLPISALFNRRFFSENRLVSSNKLKKEFPNFQPRKFTETKLDLKAYYHYRFTDDIPI